jgi:enoyl-CoA hydratase/carnithine racemase
VARRSRDSSAQPSDADGDEGAEAENDVTVDQEGDVAVVTLRRPPHNLLTEPVLRALADAVAGLHGVARAAVVCSEGRSFCAGADFRSGDAPDPTEQGNFEERTGAFYKQAVRIFDSPLPLVAAVQGAAIGAGFGLALACDFCVVGELGWFQANFVRLGIHPGFALSATLPRVVGPGRASELLLTGRRVVAAEAGRIGIAQRVVPSGDEVAVALEMATLIAGGAPLAVASTRATLRHGLADAARQAMHHELAEQAALAGTSDAIEGVSAMLEGREPRFEGH